MGILYRVPPRTATRPIKTTAEIVGSRRMQKEARRPTPAGRGSRFGRTSSRLGGNATALKRDNAEIVPRRSARSGAAHPNIRR